MHLEDFSGDRIFIDSNIFIYASSKNHSLKPVCEDFLLDIENGETNGFINGRIVDEVFHKLTIIEISNKFRINSRDALAYIKANPDVLKEFKNPRSIVEDILALERVKFLDINRKTVFQALKYSNALLFSDAIHASCCRIHNITHIATNDSDFERIAFLNIWKPQHPE
ncbi:MAG: type II toxin-antitoxin system VapC family toxin [Candidatus Methanofastidiosia archaeon]